MSTPDLEAMAEAFPAGSALEEALPMASGDHGSVCAANTVPHGAPPFVPSVEFLEAAKKMLEQSALEPRGSMGGSVSAAASAGVGAAGRDHNLDLLQNELQRMLDQPPPTSSASSLDTEACRQIQEEEREALEAIFGEELLSLSEDGTMFQIILNFLEQEMSPDEMISLWFSFPEDYPNVPPIFEIEANRSRSFSVSQADRVFDRLLAASVSMTGDMMIYNLVTIAKETIHDVREEAEALAQVRQRAFDKSRPGKPTANEWEEIGPLGDIRELYDRMASTEADDEDSFDEGADDCVENYLLPQFVQRQTSVTLYDRLLSCDSSQPATFVGSVRDIFARMPPEIQIIRMENVLRPDLAQRFTECWKLMLNAYWQLARRKSARIFCDPVLAFHGTEQANLPSIVEKGLLVPGAESGISVANGSAYGVGIYTSPNPLLSLGYARGAERLIVCAVLLGRPCDYSSKQHAHPQRKTDSVISPCGQMYVLSSSDQVLPCYVIDVKVRPNAPSKPPAPKKQNIYAAPPNETRKEKSQRLIARARKFLPYGFGPVCGNKMVIEAVATPDDDEDNVIFWKDNEQITEAEMVRTELQKYRYTEQDT